MAGDDRDSARELDWINHRRHIMPIVDNSSNENLATDLEKTPADYDEYGEEPRQDESPNSPEEALTDPA